MRHEYCHSMYCKHEIGISGVNPRPPRDPPEQIDRGVWVLVLDDVSADHSAIEQSFTAAGFYLPEVIRPDYGWSFSHLYRFVLRVAFLVRAARSLPSESSG
ncbi:hypothetical protein GCM10009020_33490 [Natronoarchaeum mannanilyticum]|uniref:Uncharacterized protein n=1 Tax=Natronoarchaeum mannanilyticum TaxID=926360 RepID=A0AAV3TEM2_9EURY